MKLYLINKNPIISKLVALSVSKLGVEMEESPEIDLTLGAEIVLIDDECFEQELFDSYKSANPEAKFGLFYAKSTERLEGFNEYIQKPFLPTDLVKTLSKVSGITPIDNQQVHQKGDSDDLEMDDAESLDNLDDELDLSGFDDLQLDDEESNAESSDGEEQLDFGADDAMEEGIEEAGEDANVPLDFGAEEGIEEATTEDGDAQLDFGADDSEEESADLNVLDKGDVEEIKDLLSNEEALPEPAEASSDLGEEMDLGSDSSASEDLDFGDLQAELDNIEVAEDSKEESLESQGEDFDVQLEGLGGDDIKGNSADFAETGGEGEADLDLDLDFGNETKEAESLENAESDLLADADLELPALDEEIGEEKAAETTEEMEQDKGEESADSSASELDIGELGDLESSSNDVSDSDLGDLDLSTDSADSLTDLTAEASESTEDDLGDLADLGDLNLESQEETQEELEKESQELLDLDMGAESEMAQADEVESENAEDSITEDLSENLEVDLTGDLDLPLEEESKEEPVALEGLDEFDSLSAEGMSEALGEPIAKAPNPAPIVPNASVAEDSALPSNIQANSLESLIGALQALQSQNLKDLLSGASISINIQFPKKD
ncbi:MAG: hypothetical protein K2N75_02190 [Helicobacter sp.]|uniref:hypothetical protein n=1 Tax=Helicobacter sp. TaxID=218 RepID=UPI0023D71577|nr:hypothetical protein [Helicobacter sp.]MDE7174851.1 hypothetical protein [Helicobacter sp.]